MVVTPVTPDAGRVRLVLRNFPELTRPGGALRIRPVGSDELVYVLVADDGGHVALSPTCKHQGCTVDIAGSRLECPCHGSMYDRTGGVLRGPTTAPLDRYRAETRDGVLTIFLREAA